MKEAKEAKAQIKFYINTGDQEQNAMIRQMLSSSQVDNVVKSTLQTAGITQPVMLTILLTDEKAIRQMNRSYRQQDKATDVLSFPLLDKPLVKAPADELWVPVPEGEGEAQAAGEKVPEFVTPPTRITNLGDIAISWLAVLEQSTEAGHHALYELLYLISHGVLHLIGYDDQSEAGYQAMVHIQVAVLQSMGIKAQP